MKNILRQWFSRRLWVTLCLLVIGCGATVMAQETGDTGKKYVRIGYSGDDRVVDLVSGNLLEIKTLDKLAETQQWEMVTVGESYQFVNRSNGLALCDPTTDPSVYETRINVVEPDASSAKQLWDVVAQDNNCYNLINKASGHTFNLKGGTTLIISWQSDPNGKNKTSAGRLWKLIDVEEGTDTPDDPEDPGKEALYYRIVNANSGGRVVDVETQNPSEGRGLILMTKQPSNVSQHWIMKRVGQYYMFLSRLGEWAINDPTQGATTPTTNLATQMNIVVADSTSQSQLWEFVPQSGSYGNLINVATQHTLNVNDGKDADGTKLISWKSEPDGGNKTSKNRQWMIEPVEDNIGDVDDTPTDSVMARLSDCPHIYIYTQNRVAITSKKAWTAAEIYYVDEQDNIVHYEDLDIRARGNSTYSSGSAYKMPYRIRFGEPVQFLGPDRANARNWTLMANAYDKTMMRNALTSELSDIVGLPFAPGAKFVDVSMNGVYVGTYQISDHMEAMDGRVELPQGQGDDVSYFLECDGYADHVVVKTAVKGVSVRIHSPKDNLTTSQKNFVKSFMDDFENRLFGAQFKDPKRGYRAVVDSITLADWYILDEVSANVDGFWSQYFYKKAGDPKLYFGPVWDYDIAYANDNRKGDTSKQLMKDVAYEQDHNGSWINRMWEDPWFQRLITRRYAELVADGLQQKLIAKIDSLAQVLDETQKANYAKYGYKTEVLRQRLFHDNYAAYVKDLKDFINTRVPFLTDAFGKLVTGEKPWEEEPDTPAFEGDEASYYKLRSEAVAEKDMMMMAYNEKNVRSMQDGERANLLWAVRKVGDAWQILSNTLTTAMTDPGKADAQVILEEPDETNKAQLWKLVPQQTGHRYNLVNVETGRMAFLRGGANLANNGNYILSTSVEDGSTNAQAIWSVVKAGEIPTGLEAISAEDVQAPLYDLSGRRVDAPARGLYIQQGRKVLVR